jgi:hypothetical protein
MHGMLRATTLCGVILAVCACAGAFGERVHEQFHQLVSVSGVPTVRVDNVAGTIRIDAWPKPTVSVEATKYGYDAGEVRNIAIDIRTEGSTIFIATKYRGVTHQGGVRYTIWVPANAAVDVRNVAGTVDLAGVAGNVTVETQAGSVGADLGRVDGDRSIDLHATTGAIKLSMTRDSSASVEASSVVGAFSSDFPEISASRENVVGVRAAGKIGSGSANVRLTTTTGAIDLTD